MGKYFFYTDPSKLGANNRPSNAHGAFGPVPSIEVSANHDKYHLCNVHQGSDAPAIAVCDGIIAAQRDDQGGLTLILKPAHQPPLDFPYIAYFIYRGIDPDSLIASGGSNSLKGMESLNATVPDIPFIKRTSTGWDEDASPRNQSADILGLAYGASFNFTKDNNPPIFPFTDDDQIENLFAFEDGTGHLPRVFAGEVIGGFLDTHVGFEIRLERLGYTPELSEVRIRDRHLEVEQIPDPLRQSGSFPTDDSILFEHWHAKEACLNHMDPCAFYGSFGGSRIFHMTDTDRVKSNTSEEIQTNILSKFDNRGKVYLDIRNDFNRSLSYFKDCQFDRKLSNRDDQSEITLDRSLIPWPILIFEKNDLGASGIEKRDFFRTKLIVPYGNCSHPIAFLTRAHVKNFGRLKRKHRVQKFPTNTIVNPQTFIEGIKIAFPLVDYNGSQEFLSGYFRVNIYDQNRKQNAPTAPALTPPKTYYMDSLFQPHHMHQAQALKKDSFKYTLWHEEVLVQLADLGEGGPIYVATIGLAEDEHHNTLFAFPSYFIQGRRGQNFPDAFTSWVTQSESSTDHFISQITSLFKSKKLTKVELKIKQIDNSIDDVDAIVFENHPFSFLDNVFSRNEDPEDFVFIIFDKSDFDGIKSDMAAGISSTKGLPALFVKDSLDTKTDENGKRYQEVMFDGISFDDAQPTIQKSIINLNKTVYEYANW